MHKYLRKSSRNSPAAMLGGHRGYPSRKVQNSRKTGSTFKNFKGKRLEIQGPKLEIQDKEPSFKEKGPNPKEK